jgi:two-component system, NtrC family, response regulator AtoC
MIGRILIVDDDPEMGHLLREGLARRCFDVRIETDPGAAFECVGREGFDAVVSDVRMRGMSGIEFCERIAANYPAVPVLLITAFGSLDTAIGAIRAGAYDFLPKPFEVEELAFRLERAVQQRSLTDEVKRLREVVREPAAPGALLGESAPMNKLRALADRFAASDAPVLIAGETGSGKELVARYLHERSARGDRPFVAVNCAALPEGLLESELFGHVRGAFTDAHEARAGLLAEAGGGTLFLDEIGELPLALQPKLLRALQERRVRPVGGTRETAFEARIVAATNSDLELAVEEGRFRQDLLFRLDVLRIEVPPLRARGGDVLLLAQHFARRCAERTRGRRVELSRGAAEKLYDYGWPGNVRELESCIERAVLLAEHEEVLVEDLPERVRSYGGAHVLASAEDSAELVPMEVVERRYITRVLESVGSNKTLAARILGFDRKTLYRKLERFDRSPR